MKKIFGIILILSLFISLQACAEGIPKQDTSGLESSSGAIPIGENPNNSSSETLGGDSNFDGDDINGDTDGGSPNSPSPGNKPNTIIYVQSLTNSLSIRTKPSLSGAVTGSINNNDRVLYLGTENGWYKTYYKNSVAYISSSSLLTKLVTMEKGSEKIETVIEIGSKYLGTPYVYGAVRLHGGTGVLLKNFTDKKFDCSSYTQFMFYYGASYNLDVTTRTQVKQGTNVTDLRRGDLMFFTNASRYYNKGTERIGHVAVYLGDNYILHTASDYAVIEPISATRWNYYIEARRVI